MLKFNQRSPVAQRYLPAGRQGARDILEPMFYVYAIKSLEDGRIYVGISQDPSKRLIGHNRGDTKSTKPYRPWRLVYRKASKSRADARREEKRLKSGYGKEFLKSVVK